MNSFSQTLELALKHHQAGDLHQAEALYRQILQVDPQNVQALHLFGVVAHQAGNNDLAVDCIQRALRLHPQFPAACNNLGMAQMAQGKPAEAAASYRQAVRLKPDYADAYYNLGIALNHQGKVEEAVASYQQALRLSPDMAEAHNKLGIALRIQGRIDEAIMSYRQALRLKPEYAEAYFNLGGALRVQGHLEEAIANYRQALRLRPNDAQAWNNLGNVLIDQGSIDEAIASYEQALRLRPDDANAWNNLGNALRDQGNLDRAIAGCREAIRLKPDLAQAHVNLAMILLQKGDFAQGWPEYEWRWHIQQLKPDPRHLSRPHWQGDPLPHGTILLHSEQGLGDTLQFIRFAALVKQRIGTVLCECPASLAQLLRSCAGIDRIIPYGESLPAHDVHAPLMSLPGILETTLEIIPASIPYLHADALLKEAQAHELAGSKNFKIGLVWQGNPKTWDADFKRSDRQRSIPLAHFEALANVPGVQLVSLQKGFGTEQIGELAGRFPIAELGSTCDDFADTAAVMKNLDLVISVDTSTAHLAGALGVPVWVPLPWASCWRWLMEREDSPWYPTMRLFRQPQPGDWAGVLERMAGELRELI